MAITKIGLLTSLTVLHVHKNISTNLYEVLHEFIKELHRFNHILIC